MPDMALQRRLLGQQDSRSTRGIMSRGANVYNGASLAAHSGGGPQYGRPPSPMSQQQNVQPNFRQDLERADPFDLNPQPVNLLSAIQRRLMGSQNGLRL